MLSAGTKLGRYEIRSKIGEGGMGEVYLAQDMKLDRHVAIKFLSGNSTTDSLANKRLLREAQAAAKLDHPNICAVHEVSDEGGHLFIVMQYVEGETLDERMNRKPLSIRECLEIGGQIADALAEAHLRGIIHRDIKPSNIIITARGQVKMMDFGVAKVVGETVDKEADTQSLLTAPGTIIGTMPYMSPEQVRGENVDSRSDIFSFGVLLYEMLTSHQPFARSNPVATISAILTLAPKSIHHFCPDAPDDLVRLVEKCLEKERHERYATMSDVALDLERVRRQQESGSAGKSPSDETFKNRQRSTVKPVTSAAYDYYLRGIVNVSSQNREDNESAINLLTQAIEADSNFAPAYAALARAYSVKAFFFASRAEKKKLNEDAKVAVEKSLALDPNLADGHAVRGYVLWAHENRFPHEQAILSFKRAIALDPSLRDAHNELGFVYYHIGLLDKAWHELEQALLLDPSDTLARFGFGLINLCRANYEEALAVLKTVPREANPGMVDGATATALFHLGRIEEATELVEDHLKMYSVDEGSNVTSVKAMLLAKAGATEAAEETIQLAVNAGMGFKHFHHATFNIASAYVLMDKPAQAIKWFQFTVDDGFPCYPLFENDRMLSALRNNDRFSTLMTQLKRQWERYNATL